MHRLYKNTAASKCTKYYWSKVNKVLAEKQRRRCTQNLVHEVGSDVITVVTAQEVE